MTDTRARAIEALTRMTPEVIGLDLNEILDRITAHIASVLGAGEKTSRSNAGEVCSDVPATVVHHAPARGLEEAGTDSDALKLAREVLETAPSFDSGLVGYWIARSLRLAREVVRLHESSPQSSSSTADGAGEGRRWWLAFAADGHFEAIFWSEPAAKTWVGAPGFSVVEVVPASRADAASRDRDAAVARAEAAEQARDVHARSAMSYRDKWEAAEARVLALEAALRKQHASLLDSAGAAGVAAIDAGREQGAADMRERAAKVCMEAPLCSTDRDSHVCGELSRHIRALPLSPAPSTPTSADDEAGGKERTK